MKDKKKDESMLLEQFKKVMSGKLEFVKWKELVEKRFVLDKTYDEKQNYIKYYELRRNMIKEPDNGNFIIVFITMAMAFITFVMGAVSSNIGILMEQAVSSNVINNVTGCVSGIWDIINAEIDVFTYLFIAVVIAYVGCIVIMELLDNARQTRRLFMEEMIKIIKEKMVEE